MQDLITARVYRRVIRNDSRNREIPADLGLRRYDNRMAPVRPRSLVRHGDDYLRIVWNDGRVGLIPWLLLREVCPCAVCREERTQPPNPLRVLKDSEIPRGPLRPTALKPVGNYAYQVAWNDGHDTGIFPFEMLYSLCEWEIAED